MISLAIVTAVIILLTWSYLVFILLHLIHDLRVIDSVLRYCDGR